MKRWVIILSGVAMVAGCGNGSSSGTGKDMALGGGDLTTTPTDDGSAAGGDMVTPPQGGNSGDPCTKDTDCTGTKPTCLTKAGDGSVWPGGYCTSNCNPNKNDAMTGANPNCPGGGTCIGQDTMGACEANCTDMKGSMPCTRAGYVCAQGCEPSSLYECDPTKKIGQAGGCPQDGGVFLPGPAPDGGNADAGTSTYSGRVCVRLGADNVGQCTDGCNVFTQNCQPDAMGNDQACYASDDTGEGVCSAPYGNPPGADGDACQYLNGCAAGLGCWSDPKNQNAPGVCRPFCGGPGNAACKNGKTCVDLSMTVMKSAVGSCAM